MWNQTKQKNRTKPKQSLRYSSVIAALLFQTGCKLRASNKFDKQTHMIHVCDFFYDLDIQCWGQQRQDMVICSVQAVGSVLGAHFSHGCLDEQKVNKAFSCNHTGFWRNRFSEGFKTSLYTFTEMKRTPTWVQIYRRNSDMWRLWRITLVGLCFYE